MYILCIINDACMHGTGFRPILCHTLDAINTLPLLTSSFEKLFHIDAKSCLHYRTYITKHRRVHWLHCVARIIPPPTSTRKADDTEVVRSSHSTVSILLVVLILLVVILLLVLVLCVLCVPFVLILFRGFEAEPDDFPTATVEDPGVTKQLATTFSFSRRHRQKLKAQLYACLQNHTTACLGS